MEVKEIVKKMLEQGMTPERIKASLRELGFENAEQLVDSVAGLTKSSRPNEVENKEQGEKEIREEMEKDEELAGNLFEEEKQEAPPAGLMGSVVEKEKKEAEIEESRKVEEIEETKIPPELKITSVTEEGEKELDIQQMLSKASELPKPIALSATEASTLKAKLDETIALLKALQEINKRILETDREVLLRLKKE